MLKKKKKKLCFIYLLRSLPQQLGRKRMFSVTIWLGFFSWRSNEDNRRTDNDTHICVCMYIAYFISINCDFVCMCVCVYMYIIKQAKIDVRDLGDCTVRFWYKDSWSVRNLWKTCFKHGDYRVSILIQAGFLLLLCCSYFHWCSSLSSASTVQFSSKVCFKYVLYFLLTISHKPSNCLLVLTHEPRNKPSFPVHILLSAFAWPLSPVCCLKLYSVVI